VSWQTHSQRAGKWVWVRVGVGVGVHVWVWVWVRVLAKATARGVDIGAFGCGCVGTSVCGRVGGWMLVGVTECVCACVLLFEGGYRNRC